MSFVQIDTIIRKVPDRDPETAEVWINPDYVNCVRESVGETGGKATITLSRAAFDAHGKQTTTRDFYTVVDTPAQIATKFPLLIAVQEFDRTPAAPSKMAYVNPANVKSVSGLNNFHLLHFADGSALDVADPAPVTKAQL